MADVDRLEGLLGVLRGELERPPEGLERLEGLLGVLSREPEGRDREAVERFARALGTPASPRARVSVRPEGESAHYARYAAPREDSGAWEAEGREALRRLALKHGKWTLRLCGPGGQPSDAAEAYEVPADAWKAAGARLSVRCVFKAKKDAMILGVLLELDGAPVRYGPLGVFVREGKRLEAEAEVEF